jgi:hypothetical protein
VSAIRCFCFSNRKRFLLLVLIGQTRQAPEGIGEALGVGFPPSSGSCGQGLGALDEIGSFRNEALARRVRSEPAHTGGIAFGTSKVCKAG